MDASEGQRFSHVRSANEIENDDEHWLWSHVSRIKRSIGSVFGNDNEQSIKRVKRGFWDLWNEPATEAAEDAATTTTTTESSFFNFDPFGLMTDDKSTTKSPESEEVDNDLDSPEGSGSSRSDDLINTWSPYCELHIFFNLVRD